MLSALFALSLFSAPQSPQTSVFGPDLRVHAYDTLQDSGVELLQLASGYCSSFLVTPSFALTAGHCTQDNPQSLKVDLNGSWMQPIAIDQAWTSPDYAITKDANGEEDYTHADWGLVHLHAPVPSFVHPLEIAAPSDVVVGAPAMSIGYPGPGFNGQWRVKDPQCTIRGVTDDSILSDCATATGNSGGPLLVLTRSGKWKVAGVCSSGFVNHDGTMIQGDAYTPEHANHFTNITVYWPLLVNTINSFYASQQQQQ